MWYRAQMMADGQWSYSQMTHDPPKEWEGGQSDSQGPQPPPSDDWTEKPWVKQSTDDPGWFRCLPCAKWITDGHLEKETHKEKVRKWMSAHMADDGELAADEGQLALTVADAD